MFKVLSSLALCNSLVHKSPETEEHKEHFFFCFREVDSAHGVCGAVFCTMDE